MLSKIAINYSKAVMSHVRDITVIHTIDKRIFFDIPLYYEKSIKIESARVENGRLIVIAKPSPSRV